MCVQACTQAMAGKWRSGDNFFFFFQRTIFEKVSSLCPPWGSQGRDSGSQSFMLGGQHLYTLRHLCGLKAIMFTCVWAGWVFSSTFLMSELHFHSLVSSSLCFITADFSFGVFLLVRTHSFVCALRPYGAYFHFQTLYWFHFKPTCSSFPLCSVVSLCFHIFLNLSLLTLHAVHFRVFRVLILWRVLCGYSFSWSWYSCELESMFPLSLTAWSSSGPPLREDSALDQLAPCSLCQWWSLAWLLYALTWQGHGMLRLMVLHRMCLWGLLGEIGFWTGWWAKQMTLPDETMMR